MAWELLARESLSAGAVVEHGVVTLVGRRCQRDGFAVSLEVLDSHTKARPHPGRAFCFANPLLTPTGESVAGQKAVLTQKSDPP
jgi:hypothetical protein